MLSNAAGVALLILVVLSVGSMSSAYTPVLSAEDIQDAQAYGERIRDPALNLARVPADDPRRRDILIENAAEGVTIVWMTPFLFLATERAKRDRPLSPQEVRAVLDGMQEYVYVTVVPRTREQVAPRVFSVLVQRPNNSIVRPDDITTKYVAFDSARSVHVFNINAKFSYAAGISPTEAVMVVVGWPTRTLTAEFLLASLR